MTSTKKITNSKNQKLKLLLFILQHYSNFHAVLAKIQAIKQVNRPYFLVFTPSNIFNFKKKTCILHHLAFLDWLQARNFLSPITRFYPLKSYFLTTIFPLSAMCFMVLKGYVYTITVDIYAFLLAFSTILPCVLHHFTLRLASKRSAFCTKTHCVQHQIAVHLAPKRSVFSGKQPKIQCKWRSF